MGLDTVEIVMRIEEEFAIDLPDAELEQVRTVGDLHELVLSKLKTTTASSCLSSKAFYRTRLAIVNVLGTPKRSIRPATPLESILPIESRRETWDAIRSALGAKFPDLKASITKNRIFNAAILVVPTSLVLALWWSARSYVGLSGPSLGLALVLRVMLLVLTLVTLAGVIRRSASNLPVATAGDLSRLVLTMNFAEFSSGAAPNQPMSQEDVWRRIVCIFCDQMQLDEGEIRPEARIHRDLGID